MKPKQYKIFAPWEKAFKKVSTPFEDFLHKQTTTGLVLMAMTLLALILANTPLYAHYEDIFHTHLSIVVGSFALDYSLHHWINDGLMALFFFVIGLEIKREVLTGELSDIKNAILPIVAALGGVIAPALIYYGINHGLPSENGWGIPMATDIAFAISALVLLGKRVPLALVTFLVALAIVDDLVAVLVIAIFYTDQIHYLPLLISGISFGVLIVFNRFGIHSTMPYFVVGSIMWIFMLQSGVHATIAGILTAMTIPSHPKINPRYFDEFMEKLTQKYANFKVEQNYELHEEQKTILHHMNKHIQEVQSPLNRLEHSLHLPVSLIIIPLFALANAGIAIDFKSLPGLILEPTTLGVMFGLVVGKVLGIFGVAFVAIKLGIAKLPKHTSMNQLFGVSFLGGIGFTMSIFIADLALIANNDLLLQAKTGILLASLIAGLIGFVWLRFIATKQ